MDLLKEIREVAESGILPDGDEVNISTCLWLEDLIWRMNPANDEDIISKINRLQQYAEQDGCSIDSASLESFKNFLEWMGEIGNFFNMPIISLTPDNEIYATWQGEKRHSLCFKKDMTIKYIVLDRT